jgi:hypothetical protein
MKQGNIYSVDTVFEDAYKDPRVVQIIRNICPSVFANPRFHEIYEFTLMEILQMDLVAVAGVTKTQLKRMFKEIIALDKE